MAVQRQRSSGGRAILEYVVTFVSAPQVFVKADNNTVIATDSLAFTAQSLGVSETLTPVGWRWRSQIDTIWDPWTKASAGTALTCKIQVHGSGTMFFTALRQNGDSLIGSFSVVADLPPLAQDDGDADVEVPLPSDTTTIGSEISEQQGSSIPVKAYQPRGTPPSYEWVYTQGCASCWQKKKHGPFYEPAVDTALKIGDCTDFTLTAIHGVLGDGFRHAKIGTTHFNHWVADSAAHAVLLRRAGYVQVAKPQTGDVVVRAKDGPTPADTSRKWNGHAGVFIGFAVKGADSTAVGTANNGTPATFTNENGDSTTKAISFKRGPGYLVKFFRPLTTLPSP